MLCNQNAVTNRHYWRRSPVPSSTLSHPHHRLLALFLSIAHMGLKKHAISLTEKLNRFAEGDDELINLVEVLEDVEASIGFRWYLSVTSIVLI